MSVIRDYLLYRKVKKKQLYHQQQHQNQQQQQQNLNQNHLDWLQQNDDDYTAAAAAAAVNLLPPTERKSSNYQYDKCDGRNLDDEAAWASTPTRARSHQVQANNRKPSTYSTSSGSNIWNRINLNTLNNINSGLFSTKKAKFEPNGGGDGDSSSNGDKPPRLYANLNHEGRPRLVKKCGELNIDVESVPKRKRRLLSDFFNTVLDIKWRWHVVIFVMTFLISWIVFASVWYLIGTYFLIYFFGLNRFKFFFSVDFRIVRFFN